MTIDEKIDQVYDELFDFVVKEHDDLFELLIEYKDNATGKTIRRSWHDREKRLAQQEKS